MPSGIGAWSRPAASKAGPCAGDTVHINDGPGITVTAIEKFRKQLDEASAGENVGLLMKGIKREDLNRGDVLTSSSSSSSTATCGEAPPI